MTAQGWVQIASSSLVLTALVPLVGGYIASVFQGERVFLSPVIGPIERFIYRVLRVRPDDGQDWKAYARSRRLQPALLARALPDPAHPEHPAVQPEGFDSGPWNLSFNTDLLLRHQHQLAVLRRRDDALLLLADGRADGAELRLRRGRDRGARRGDPRLRRPLRQLARQLLVGPGPASLYILLPISFVARPRPRLAGRDPDARRLRCFTTLAGSEQTLALGPVASQEAIKELGTNGGGFFNVNSAYPFENPTAFTNFVELLLILIIPASLTYTFGRMVGNRRQGWALYAAMMADVHRRRRRRLRGRAARHARAAPCRGRHRRLRRLDRRQHGGQGAALRDRRQHRCGLRSPPSPPAARSTPPSTR